MNPSEFIIRYAVVASVLGFCRQVYYSGYERVDFGPIYHDYAMWIAASGWLLWLIVCAITPFKWFWGDE